ncbi:MAG TPA: MerR family transcriptional regulator, partial [Acidimicrobiales bacterium]|nr:MerR family transcriptional regulator [Acidimicrobiales bacterium]
MEDRAYLSIGEVLALLKEEFPDVTISKIRFLESQGLLDPERTPSGYRKFYESDVERLRWILRQQREHFLPLKVIKGRLRGGGSEGGTDAGTAALDTAAVATPDRPAGGSGSDGSSSAVAAEEAAPAASSSRPPRAASRPLPP